MVFVAKGAGMSVFSWQAGGSLVITPDVQPCGLHLALAPSVFTSKADFLSLSRSNKGPFMCSSAGRRNTHQGSVDGEGGGCR